MSNSAARSEQPARADAIRRFIDRIINAPKGTAYDPHVRAAVCRMLFSLYERQTEHERGAARTHRRNKIGFNKPDGRILSVMVRVARDKQNGDLTQAQTWAIAKRLRKYADQLAEILNERKESPRLSPQERR